LYLNRKNEWYWFIHSVLSTAGEGNTLNLVPPYGFVTDIEEIKKVANYIDDKINRILSLQ
jgi:hypothetical protein